VPQDTAGVLRTIGNEGTTRMNLDYKLFKGVSVQLDDVENAEETAFKIASSPSVKNVWPVEVYSIPKPKVNWVGTPDSSRAAGGLSKRSNETEGYAPHKMTQIDELHKKGFTGKGVKIAVIDTGVSNRHPRPAT
jgi:subtilisin family serine protease